MSCNSVSRPGAWIKHKQFTATTSGSGNIAFTGLTRGKHVILYAVTANDTVALPYFISPSTGTLGAHIIRDTASHASVTNTRVTVDVWYYEIPSA